MCSFLMFSMYGLLCIIQLTYNKISWDLNKTFPPTITREKTWLFFYFLFSWSIYLFFGVLFFILFIKHCYWLATVLQIYYLQISSDVSNQLAVGTDLHKGSQIEKFLTLQNINCFLHFMIFGRCPNNWPVAALWCWHSQHFDQ